MITRELYCQAAASAVQLHQAGISLKARPGSVLGQLIEACRQIVVEKRDSTMLPEIFISGKEKVYEEKTISFRAEDTHCITSMDGMGNHTSMVLDVVESLKPIVLNHVSSARNVVLPLVKELEEGLEKFIEYSKSYDPATEFSIVVPEIPMFLEDESFKGMGFVYNPEYRVTELQKEVIFDKIETDPATMLVIGNARLDEMLKRWLATLPPDFVKNVFNVNFSKSESDFRICQDYSLSQYSAQLRNPYDELAISTVVYLLAMALKMTPAKTTQSLTEGEYSSRMTDLMTFSGTIAVQQLKRVKTSIAGNIVVVEGDMVKKRIVVNKSIYRDYLTKGGTSEALLGMLVSSRYIYSMSAILDSVEGLTRTWNTYISTTRYKDEIQIKQLFIEQIKSMVLLGLENPTELEKGYFAEYPNAKTEIMKKVDEEIAHLSHRLMQDLFHTALHMIAKARFYYTGAYDILNEITMITESNEDIDPREAANLATMKYIIRYLLAQVTSAGAASVMK